MWNVTDVLDAPPVIVLVAARTCFMSKIATVLAAIATVVANDVPARPSVNVALLDDVFDTTTFVTTVVVEDGTV